MIWVLAGAVAWFAMSSIAGTVLGRVIRSADEKRCDQAVQ